MHDDTSAVEGNRGCSPRRLLAGLVSAAALLTGLMATDASATAADLPYGPYTCATGFVWREAYPSDVVCVTPAVRSQTATENALAPSRVEPNGGPYGPDTCKQGFVWRETRPADHVCALPAGRDQAHTDNAAAVLRLADPTQLPYGPVSVTTTYHQLGGYLYANSGGGLTPGGAVKFFATGINTTGPYSLGTLTADAAGALPGWQYVFDIRCRSGQTQPATIVVLDQASGAATKAGPTDAFRHCG